MQVPPKSVKSPCIKICEMNPVTGLCSGCYRTLSEIANWSQMTQTQKEALLSELETRKFKWTI